MKEKCDYCSKLVDYQRIEYGSKMICKECKAYMDEIDKQFVEYINEDYRNKYLEILNFK